MKLLIYSQLVRRTGDDWVHNQSLTWVEGDGPPGSQASCGVWREDSGLLSRVCNWPSSVAPDPAESRGAPPPPQDPSPLRGTLGCVLSCSVVSSPFVTPWTVARPAPLSLRLSRQEFWTPETPPSSRG